MGSFRDSKGSLWELTVDIPTVKRVRSLTGIDLLNVALGDRKASVFAALSDPITFAEVLYAICKPEADSRGLTDEDFARLLDVDVEQLAETLLEGIADFFQRRNQTQAAALVRWQIRKSKTAAERMRTTLTPEAMDSLDRAFDAAVDDEISRLRSLYGSGLTNLEASQESIHTPAE